MAHWSAADKVLAGGRAQPRQIAAARQLNTNTSSQLGAVSLQGECVMTLAPPTARLPSVGRDCRQSKQGIGCSLGGMNYKGTLKPIAAMDYRASPSLHDAMPGGPGQPSSGQVAHQQRGRSARPCAALTHEHSVMLAQSSPAGSSPVDTVPVVSLLGADTPGLAPQHSINNGSAATAPVAGNPARTIHQAAAAAEEDEVVPETGVLPEEAYRSLNAHAAGRDIKTKAAASAVPSSTAQGFAYPPAERSQIRESWGTLMRWSRVFRTRKDVGSPLEATRKIVVFGGGSFGTAIGSTLAHQKSDLEVVMLLRDPYLCKDINNLHCNTRYLKDFKLPNNVRATTNAAEAISGAQYAVHAVPVQSSRAFLVSIRDLLPASVPIICVSKGLEVGTGLMMSELIPSALERKQPAVFLSGPSFAREVMENRPTGVVAACKDTKLARTVQALFASQNMRVNTTSDVTGVEICGALKNVLAIAAGIVEGLDLGHNAMAALIAQGCSEIRWLLEKMGAKPTTMSGLSGLGDIMLTCYGSLSRNRSVGIRLGQGEKLADILASSPQVAEGVATAGVVVSLARKYRVSLPVLTAVAQVLDNALTPSEAVSHIMNLPQIEER